MSSKPDDSKVAQAQTLLSGDRFHTDPKELAHANTEIADVSTGSGASHPAVVRLAEAQLEDDGFESRYEGTSVLGQGGMGEVRVCRDRRIGREVALKVVHEKYSQRFDMKERFLREARVQGQLEHPSIVPVYDLARGPDGEPYFTMKRVRGNTLEKILDALKAGDEEAKKKYSPRKLLAAVTSVCLALDFVHGRGVVHRDLKPSNIMLGDFGEVYLLDWGLAKILGASETVVTEAATTDSSQERVTSAPSVLTSAGTLLGTPGYMPREQLVGHLVEVDARVDVYALGAILFELLTYERLHVGATLQDVLRSTMNGAESRPSVRAPAREVPPELEAICVKATATTPADRYASAREMSDAIERYLDGDRDLQQRHEMAARHARAAEEAAASALGHEGAPAEASRRTAMREFSRALALDPENPATMRAMVRLLMQPPRELPAEVKEEIEQLSRDQVRLGGKTGGLAYLSINLYIPLLYMMGIRSPWMWSTYAIALATSILSFGISRMKAPRTRHAMTVFTLSLISVATMAGNFGPFVIVPAVAVTSALVFSTTNDRSLRGVIILLATMAVVVPFALEQMGVVPPSMRFTPEGILLLPRVVWFPPFWTGVFLIVSNVALVVTAGLVLAPFRNELDDAQKRIRLLAWHLRQLVPSDAVDGSDAR
jgi:tRNA A-37 threonylcarbamoyl transferase component Bud32